MLLGRDGAECFCRASQGGLIVAATVVALGREGGRVEQQQVDRPRGPLGLYVAVLEKAEQ